MSQLADARVLVVGVSTRAIVESAVRAGYTVTSVDAYADCDQPAAATCYSLPRDARVAWSPARAASFARDIDASAVVYGSNWENYPRALTSIARGRQLWGNGADCLRRVRDPRALRAAFRARGVDAPAVRVGAGALRGRPGTWLIKPLRSGGGHGVRPWNGGAVPRGSYLQRRVDGQPGSVVFVAANGCATVLGVTTQLVGDPSFGAHGVRYCGSLLWSRGMCAPAVLAQARRLATAATEAFGLVGVGSVDFMYRDQVMHPVEVNPRWTASTELVERASDRSMFATHVAACLASDVPRSWVPSGAVFGKAVVFAHGTVTAGPTDAWLADDSVRDVPGPGTLLPRGAPVCTVFASATTAWQCVDLLRRRAAAVYTELAQWRAEAA